MKAGDDVAALPLLRRLSHRPAKSIEHQGAEGAGLGEGRGRRGGLTEGGGGVEWGNISFAMSIRR